MELPEKFYNASQFIETASGNKVSRNSVLCGSQNIVLNGKTIIMNDTIMRGDLANIKVGRYTVIRERAVIRPPVKKFSKGVAFFPLTIGDSVYVGEDSIVSAAQVGSYVHVGKDCVVGRRSVLKDCCALADGCVLPPDTVVPPFAIFAGNPGRMVGELPECTQDLMVDYTWNFYHSFIGKKDPDKGRQSVSSALPAGAAAAAAAPAAQQAAVAPRP